MKSLKCILRNVEDSRHRPVQSVEEMFFGNVEVEVGVGGGCEGVVTAAFPAKELPESLSGEQLRGLQYTVLHQVGQT